MDLCNEFVGGIDVQLPDVAASCSINHVPPMENRAVPQWNKSNTAGLLLITEIPLDFTEQEIAQSCKKYGYLLRLELKKDTRSEKLYAVANFVDWGSVDKAVSQGKISVKGKDLPVKSMQEDLLG
ncbi:unnamed protein product, partial [Candidula unifasciata]